MKEEQDVLKLRKIILTSGKVGIIKYNKFRRILISKYGYDKFRDMQLAVFKKLNE